jgi:hypothetical protein
MILYNEVRQKYHRRGDYAISIVTKDNDYLFCLYSNDCVKDWILSNDKKFKGLLK